ncbi:hypothetical protein LTR08_001562 [Meristemomyces frigidus]|nr:hypothetical protein LTR08_001562 [Meristemomyces frigidus]
MATPNTSGSVNRITREIASIEKGDDLSIAVACRDSDVRHIRASIIGPPETPYEYGFFEFEVTFGKEYPIRSPGVRCITTNGGRCRFNPNIYSEGKVCLSILGTWRGNPGEEWSSAQGLESVLVSIQSLMSQNPYENEPGHETAKQDDPLPKAYVAKIRHETIRIAVVQRLEGLLGLGQERGPPLSKRPRIEGAFSSTVDNGAPNTLSDALATANTNLKPVAGGASSGANTPATEPSEYEYDAEATFNAFDQAQWDPFTDLMKRRFLWYYDTYVQTVTKGAEQHKKGAAFKRMEFEYPPNSMEGQFDYPGLLSRLHKIKQALEDEQAAWVKAGVKAVADETQMAVQLAFQFKQFELRWNDAQYEGSRMELSLPDKTNPFLWHLTLFGTPMTNLDGGIFNMSLFIPPAFPAVQPRLKIDTPIFHHRVSSTGTLCYFPKKEDEIASHLQAIVTAIEDEDPRFDPRAVVRPEAFALFWGGEEKRKVYSRKLRRSAQESCEF